MNITKKQLIKFLNNKNICIYLLNGWSSTTPSFDFVNFGIYGINFGVKVCDNGNVEIYNFRGTEALTNKLINEFKAITIK